MQPMRPKRGRLSLTAVRLPVWLITAYGLTLVGVVTCENGWFKYRLRDATLAVHSGWAAMSRALIWPLGISTVFQRPRIYRKIYNIRRTKSQKINYSRRVLQLSLPNSLKLGYLVENEDLVGAAPTGDAPTTSEWSLILLSTKMRLILEVWRYVKSKGRLLPTEIYLIGLVR